jgi:hypothetical protein
MKAWSWKNSEVGYKKSGWCGIVIPCWGSILKKKKKDTGLFHSVC